MSSFISKIFDLVLVLSVLYAIFKLGSFFGRNDGYLEGLIAGYDLFYKHAYEHLRDSLASVSQFD